MPRSARVLSIAREHRARFRRAQSFASLFSIYFSPRGEILTPAATPRQEDALAADGRQTVRARCRQRSRIGRAE